MWRRVTNSCHLCRGFLVTCQILFIWHLSYFKSNTKCLTEAKNNNDTTYQPSHPHKYPERQTHTHKHTQTHKLRPTAPVRQKHGRAPRPKARKELPWGGQPHRGLPAHDHRECRHRDSPDPSRQEAPHKGAESSSHPGQSSPQDSTPDSEPKAASSVVGPHEETLELKTERLKQ